VLSQAAVAWWALGIAGSPWGLVSLLLVLLHLCMVRMLIDCPAHRACPPADRWRSRGWVLLHFAAWLAIGGGMAFGIAALS
jgi:hypothetical protein